MLSEHFIFSVIVVDMIFAPETSVVVERSFSLFIHILSYRRIKKVIEN